MAPKKAKAKVSQNDLRKMMQQMKSKKLGSQPAQNNNSMKRSHQYLMDDTKTNISKPDTKKAKISSITSAYNNNDLQTHAKTVIKETSKKREYTKVFHDEKKDANNKFKKVSTEKKPKKGILLVSGFSSDSTSDNEETNVAPVVPNSSNSNGKHSQDQEDVPSSSAEQIPEKSLPAGFFDDPETDAKIRGVETPADKMDREWELFQRELQRETGQSEQIVDDEHETGNIDRQIEEIDEQMQLYQLMEKLSNKKDVTVKKLNKVEEMEVDGSESDSNGSDDGVLDWREKDIFI